MATKPKTVIANCKKVGNNEEIEEQQQIAR